MRRRLCPTALVIFLAFVAGCSDGGAGARSPGVSDQSQDSVGRSTTSAVGSGSDSSPRTPTDGVPNPEQLRPYGASGNRLVWNVREELTRRCMEEAGFHYITNPVHETPIPDPIPRLSPEKARQQGYRQLVSATTDPAPAVSPDAALPGFAEALDPSDKSKVGCFERAYREMFASSYGKTAVDMFRALDGRDITSEVESSPTFVEIVGDWRRCMSPNGFDYANMGDAVFQFVGPSAGTLKTPPSREEIRVAVADAECRRTINFERRYTELYLAQYTTWLNQNAVALREMTGQSEADLAQVKSVAKRLGVSS